MPMAITAASIETRSGGGIVATNPHLEYLIPEALNRARIVAPCLFRNGAEEHKTELAIGILSDAVIRRAKRIASGGAGEVEENVQQQSGAGFQVLYRSTEGLPLLSRGEIVELKDLCPPRRARSIYLQVP